MQHVCLKLAFPFPVPKKKICNSAPSFLTSLAIMWLNLHNFCEKFQLISVYFLIPTSFFLDEESSITKFSVHPLKNFWPFSGFCKFAYMQIYGSSIFPSVSPHVCSLQQPLDRSGDFLRTGKREVSTFSQITFNHFTINSIVPALTGSIPAFTFLVFFWKFLLFHRDYVQSCMIHANLQVRVVIYSSIKVYYV